jgi:hypothetical protein
MSGVNHVGSPVRGHSAAARVGQEVFETHPDTDARRRNPIPAKIRPRRGTFSPVQVGEVGTTEAIHFLKRNQSVLLRKIAYLTRALEQTNQCDPAGAGENPMLTGRSTSPSIDVGEVGTAEAIRILKRNQEILLRKIGHLERALKHANQCDPLGIDANPMLRGQRLV